MSRTSGCIRSSITRTQFESPAETGTIEPVTGSDTLVEFFDGQERELRTLTERAATRYRIQPRVPGPRGLAATVLGKQPDSLSMWIAQGRAPALVRFRGSLYAGGPNGCIGPTGPRWSPWP